MKYNMTKSKTWTDEQLIMVVKNSYSIASILLQLGLKPTGGNYKTIENAFKRLQLNTSHFTGKGHLKGKTHNWGRSKHLDDILSGVTDYSSSFKLKNRLLKEGLLSYKCYNEECNISSWRGKKLALQLDHINGVNSDHRLENLRLLCPNCHSQTDTFAGKNKKKSVETEGLESPVAISTTSIERVTSAPTQQNQCNKCQKPINKNSSRCSKCKTNEKIIWPSKEELEKLVWSISCSQLSKKLGVSDKAIEKRCKKLGISKPPRGYWAKLLHQ